jgi:hypothetical protein
MSNPCAASASKSVVPRGDLSTSSDQPASSPEEPRSSAGLIVLAAPSSGTGPTSSAVSSAGGDGSPCSSADAGSSSSAAISVSSNWPDATPTSVTASVSPKITSLASCSKTYSASWSLSGGIASGGGGRRVAGVCPAWRSPWTKTPECRRHGSLSASRPCGPAPHRRLSDIVRHFNPDSSREIGGGGVGDSVRLVGVILVAADGGTALGG